MYDLNKNEKYSLPQIREVVGGSLSAKQRVMKYLYHLETTNQRTQSKIWTFNKSGDFTTFVVFATRYSKDNRHKQLIKFFLLFTFEFFYTFLIIFV